jgi:hypothetical protein
MVNLIKIEKLVDIQLYEDEKTTNTNGKPKKWTKGVPIILVHENGKKIITDEWVYVNHNDELVYNKKKNLYCQGSDYYNIGKSHIKEIYVIQ